MTSISPGRRDGRRVAVTLVTMGARALLSAALSWLAPVLLFVATLSCWVRWDVTPADALGRHVRASLETPAVQEELSRRIADAVVHSDSRLVAAEPVLRTAARILIESRQFADLLDIAVQQTGRAVVRGRAADATRLTDIENELITVVAAIDPTVADRIPRGWDTRVVDLRPGSPLIHTLETGDRLSNAAPWLLPVAFATYLLAVALARQRTRALGWAGFGVAVVGIAMIAGRQVAGIRVSRLASQPSARTAVRAAYDVTTGNWRQIGIGYLLVGLIIMLAVATGPSVPAVAHRAATGTLHRLSQPPAGVGGRLAWAGAALGGAALLASTASAIGPAMALVAAIALTFVGFRFLADLLPISPALPRIAAERILTRRRLALLGGTIGVVGLPIAFVVASQNPVQARDGGLVCNGRADLCDRRLNDVAFAGTHNAMASVDAGFLFAQQRATIAGQLAGGVRALLLDTQYGLRTSTGVVWTDFRGSSRAKLMQEVGSATIDSMAAVRRSLVPTSTAAEVYLCHGYCELGATRAVDGFTAVRQFLETHPAEVVLLFLQDDTEAADTTAALKAAGLDRFAYTHRDAEPWPTLGELIRSATPLVVFAEQHGGAPLWFHPSFDDVKDTTFRAVKPNQLTCLTVRGPRDAPLFVLNNWLATSPPEEREAEVLNDQGFIVDRARRCADEQHQRVNVVAVNFWETGAVLAAVDELNERRG